MKAIKIGTRGSKLALVQAEFIKTNLQKNFPDINFEIITIKTTGDKILDSPLSKIGDKGLFTKEIEQELLAGTIDLAVHSMKDIPTMLPDGLKIGAITKRLDARDVFISKTGKKLNDLLPGDTIATSSLRRRAQLLAYKPGINIVDIRGNVITRIKKMKEDPKIDGLVLAYAGVSRLNMLDSITEIIPFEIIIPPVGQAALAIETREHDAFIDSIVSILTDEEVKKAILCERAFLAELEGGCQVPIAGYAQVSNDTISITGLVASLDGKVIYKKSLTDSISNYIQLGKNLAYDLLNDGAKEILDEIYRSNAQSNNNLSNSVG